MNILRFHLATLFTMVKNSTAEADMSYIEGTVKENWYVILSP